MVPVQASQQSCNGDNRSPTRLNAQQGTRGDANPSTQLLIEFFVDRRNGRLGPRKRVLLFEGFKMLGCVCVRIEKTESLEKVNKCLGVLHPHSGKRTHNRRAVEHAQIGEDLPFLAPIENNIGPIDTCSLRPQPSHVGRQRLPRWRGLPGRPVSARSFASPAGNLSPAFRSGSCLWHLPCRTEKRNRNGWTQGRPRRWLWPVASPRCWTRTTTWRAGF